MGAGGGFSGIDWGIVAAFMLATTWVGHLLRGKSGDLDGFFLGGRNVPWWAVSISLVATQTSALTFIAVPALPEITSEKLVIERVVPFGFRKGNTIAGTGEAHAKIVGLNPAVGAPRGRQGFGICRFIIRRVADPPTRPAARAEPCPPSGGLPNLSEGGIAVRLPYPGECLDQVLNGDDGYFMTGETPFHRFTRASRYQQVFSFRIVLAENFQMSGIEIVRLPFAFDCAHPAPFKG
jgi:hypothetical protein